MRQNYECKEKSHVPKTQLKEEIEQYFQGQDATAKITAKALRKCFPSVIHGRSGKLNGKRIPTWMNISKRTGDLPTCDISAVEQLLKSKEYSILSKNDHKITCLVPTMFEMSNMRTSIEVSIDFDNVENPVCVRFLGKKVQLDKVFQKTTVNIRDEVEMSTFLSEVKNIRPCCGYNPVGNEKPDYLWNCAGGHEENAVPRKRGRSCKLFISPSAISPTCQTCRFTGYLRWRDFHNEDEDDEEDSGDVKLGEQDHHRGTESKIKHIL